MMKEDEKPIICRVCINEVDINTKHFNIFDIYEDLLNPDPSFGKILIFNKLMSCANVVIDESDGLPDRICFSCLLELEDAFNFRRKCEKSDEILRTATKICRDPSEGELDNDNNTEFEKDTKTIDNNLIEPKCKESVLVENNEYVSQVVLTNVKIECDDELEENYVSDYNITFDSPNENNKPNCEVSHKDLNRNSIQIKKTKPKRKQAYNNNEFRESRAIDLKLECHDCGNTFKSKCKLRVHWKKHHKMLYTCSICKLQFKTHKAYDRHRKIKTKACLNFTKIRVEGDGKNLQYYCKECDYESTVRQNTLNHLIVHSIKQYECDKCSLSFLRSTALRNHNERVHNICYGEKTCHICGLFFIGYSRYSRHMQHHKEKKPEAKVQCDLCKKFFTSKASLTVHLERHSTEKNYACDMCPSKYKTYASLHIHKTRKHKEKQYSCKICGYKLAFRSKLRIHESKHSILNVGCNLCGKFLESDTQLKLHMARHNNRQHKCEQCNRSYFARSEYLKHLRSVHNVYLSQDPEEKTKFYKKRGCPRKREKD